MIGKINKMTTLDLHRKIEQYIIQYGKERLLEVMAQYFKCKDCINESACIIFKESGIVQWIHLKGPSPKALSYLDRPESNEDAIEVTEKTVFHIEDPDDAFINGSDFKLICSGEMDTVRVSADRKGIRLKLPKPGLFVTSCNTLTGNQLHRRIPSLGLDTDVKQTRAILNKKTDWEKQATVFSRSWWRRRQADSRHRCPEPCSAARRRTPRWHKRLHQ